MWIVDNFFKNPYDIRKKAIESLKSDSYQDPHWPGRRADVPKDIQQQIFSKAKSIINDKFKLPEELIFRSTFQCADKSYIVGYPHVDHEARYNCIVFLNTSAPSNTGTEVYSERYGNISGTKGYMLDIFRDTQVKYYNSNRTFVEQFFFKKEMNKLNSLFKDPCVISNKFNRVVIFDSLLVHRAQNYFGSSIKDSRLTISTFLK